MNIFDFIRDPSLIGPWFNDLLLSTGMQPWVASLIGDVIGVLLVVIVVLTAISLELLLYLLDPGSIISYR